MLYLSLIVNIVVLVPLLIAFWRDTAAMEEFFGPDTAARRILTCLYASVLLASIALLPANIAGLGSGMAWTQVLFILQVVYKLMTIVTVGLQNPVVKANAALAALHSATLVTLN